MLEKVDDDYILPLSSTTQKIWVRNSLVRLDSDGAEIEEKQVTYWRYWYYLDQILSHKEGYLLTGSDYTEWDNGNIIGGRGRGVLKFLDSNWEEQWHREYQ